MFVSDKDGFFKGFKKWSLAHPAASNDDDEPGGARPLRLSGPLAKQTESATGAKVYSHGR